MTLSALIAAQSDALEPEAFQQAIIDNMSTTLLRRPSPPCLLPAPTGSGKTFMAASTLARVNTYAPTLWFWFVPFVNLVQQTEDALVANFAALTPALLADARNQGPASGTVLLSTVQAVARARDRRAQYDADGDDTRKTLAELIALARARDLNIGLVVDEAHIALDKGTEFGRFAQWLEPDFLLMATATPRDQRLLEFLDASHKGALESFTVSRKSVVEARLNKRYLEAVVYDLRQSVSTITDLKRTVLRQAWLRLQRLRLDLATAGVDLVPLMLVQVANGSKTVEAAERDLIQICKVPPAAIGKHSADEPDPVLMAAIASDRSKQVLIFKQSAGTGFDAPRAFVLASTKLVNDADFAMQFVGRVMRVPQAIRKRWPRPEAIPADFDTAYVYLADAETQRGFESAIQNTNSVCDRLEGETEKLVRRETASGASLYTNRPTPQAPVFYDEPEQPGLQQVVQDIPAARGSGSSTVQFGLFGTADTSAASAAELDLAKPQRSRANNETATQPSTIAEAVEYLNAQGVQTYWRQKALVNVPYRLRRERRPLLADMSAVSQKAANDLVLDDILARSAARAALNLLHETEIHTELTAGVRHEKAVVVITDRAALAREAMQVLQQLPQVEDEDVRIVVDTLAARLSSIVEREATAAGVAAAEELGNVRTCRIAAYWVIRSRAAELLALLQSEIAAQSVVEDTEPLPEAMLFPTGLSLSRSRKNVYGVFPPSADDMNRIDAVLGIHEQALLVDGLVLFKEGSFLAGKFDGRIVMNRDEQEFAKALDRADFVAWWHRNPDQKPYSVRLVRGEHRNYFYPDFVVCFEDSDGQAPFERLVETKESTKDAAHKSSRVPKCYGKVLFLTRDQNRLRIINDDGSLGESLDYDELSPIRDWFEKYSH